MARAPRTVVSTGNRRASASNEADVVYRLTGVGAGSTCSAQMVFPEW